MQIICASCGAETPRASHCGSCGQNPLLESKYELLNAVGAGAFGTTYLATRLEDQAVVAIKEMLVRRADSLKVLELFEREAQILETLRHPGIPQYFEDFIHEAGRSTAFYLVQEFIEGQALSEHFNGPARVEDVFEVCAQVLEILTYLHTFSPPVVHRDIKPENIIRRQDGSLVLIDFGSVRAALDTAEGGSTVAGTFGFMAPEQFMGRALPASDVYSVGALAVALLSNDDPQKLMKGDRTLDVERLALPNGFRKTLNWMLSAEPERRPTAAQARDAIQKELRGETALIPFSASSSALVLHPDIIAIIDGTKPRPIPANFAETYLAESKFNILFGSIFVGVGAGFPVLIGIALILTGEGLVPAMFMLLFLVVFGGIGGYALYSGLRYRKRTRQVWAQGEGGQGTISQLGRSSYSVNGRAANRYNYVYHVGGKTYEGRWDSWHWQNLKPGDTVPILYDHEWPNRSLLVAVAPR